MNRRAIKILLLGFDTRVIKAFELFFLTKCNEQFLIETLNNTAPIAVIDFDIFHNKEKIEAIRKDNPEIIIFALSLIEQSEVIENIFFIKKPINYLDLKKELLNAKKSIENGQPLKRNKNRKRANSLQPINESLNRNKKVNGRITKSRSYNENEERVSSKQTVFSHSTSAANTLSKQEESYFIGNNKDVDLSNPQELLSIVYSTKHRMQRVVLKAVKQARRAKMPVHIIYLGFEFVVEPIQDIIYSVAGNSILRPLCLLDSKNIEKFNLVTGTLKVDELFSSKGLATKKIIETKIDAFLWKVALWSSRGRMPNTMDVNTPAFLMEWPNLTRLDNFPQAMRIAAYLIKQPCKLGDVAKNLDIPQRYVFSFFSAAHAIGIAGISLRKVDSTFSEKTPSKKIAPRSFLKKILGRLIGAAESNKREVAS